MTDYTEIVFILDRSGSMQGLEGDTIGGFNAMLEKNKQQEGDAVVSVVLFDDKSDVICDRVSIRKVKPLTERDYCVRGCTALLDAVGGAVRYISKVQKALPAHRRAKSVMFVITTDGYENASRKYSYKKVKKLIEAKRKAGWEFVFMGANIDSAEEASRLGIDADNAVDYCCDAAGTEALFASVAQVSCSLRAGRSLKTGSWKRPIERDREGRGRAC